MTSKEKVSRLEWIKFKEYVDEKQPLSVKRIIGMTL